MASPWTGGLRVTEQEIRGRRGTDRNVSILQVSDLHGKSFRHSRRPLARELLGLSPDIVVLTGDILDEHSATLDSTRDLLAALPRAPAFFVPGNHDPACPLYPQFTGLLESSGVRVLVNRTQMEAVGGLQVRVVGLDDPLRGRPDLSLISSGEAPGSSGPVTLVAAHSPTLGRDNLDVGSGETSLLTLGADRGAELILCGHTHGGQVRLPWIGALYVPGQGLFPRLVSGPYASKGTWMYITSGIGTSHLPLRFLCPPEVALINWRP